MTRKENDYITKAALLHDYYDLLKTFKRKESTVFGHLYVLRVMDGVDAGLDWEGKINATNNLIKRSDRKVTQLEVEMKLMKKNVEIMEKNMNNKMSHMENCMEALLNKFEVPVPDKPQG